jgi:hypothetical protein
MYGETNTPCPNGDQNRVGKVMQPAIAPGDDILLVYTSGAANINPLNINTPYDAGIYLLPSAIAASGSATPADLKLIVNDPLYDEQTPRAVAPYAAVFAGSTQPYAYPEYANPGDSAHGLPANSPFGLIGSSSLTYRDTNRGRVRLVPIRIPSTPRMSFFTTGCIRARTLASTTTRTSMPCGF